MIKLILLEGKKLKRYTVIGEVIIYWLILMFLPFFFIKQVSADFGHSFTTVMELNKAIQTGLILFGASLINQVFIDEYKNKTISLAYGYPINRKTLFTAKILFIGLLVFLVTIISFLLTGLSTYVIDQIHPIIMGEFNPDDLLLYFKDMIIRSFEVTIISFIPLYFLGIWKRLTIPTVLCAILIMQLLNFAPMFNLNLNLLFVVFFLLGGLSIILSIFKVEKVGEI
ncbi:ABC transporter permease [Psychrobacillus sp. FSL K6-2836]|uniref:ABC transporter permease n=1 Tax=Psychrobacillus sp. FSL K6-2836 TaxID=2921548 RepID=UPI0030FC5A34